MADMQANLQVLANQLWPQRTQHASPRPFRASTRHDFVHDEEEKDVDGNYYRRSPHVKRQRRILPHPKEVKKDLPHFHGRDNVEAYLDWVTKFEQLFESHVANTQFCPGKCICFVKK